MNSVNIIGNLGADPESREVQGVCLTRLRLAYTRRRRPADGGPAQESTSWFDVSLWGAAAEVARDRCRKGDRVAVSGELRQREYAARDGSRRSAVEIAASSLDLLSPRRPGPGDDMPE